MFSQSKFSSSSARLGCSYDVFLSFRGEDTRKNFTDHLYTALVRAGIHTFRDDNELPRGKEISAHLLKAIRESKMSIVVFSKGYASSKWCLNELVEILECKKRNTDQIVLPIFYDIDPSDVRKQTGSFNEAFDTHEECFKEKVKAWRKALEEAGNLSGYNLNEMANGHEAKFIQEIVKDVWNKLDPKYLNVCTNLVGVDPLVQSINVFLSTATDDVHIVGIHGMGGIGKTTIAKVVFNKLCYEFQGSCFLLNVQELSKQPNGLVLLQEQLLHGILKQDAMKIYNVDRGMVLIKERLCQKRVLVVLDDVVHLNQLNALMGEQCWFGPGSRVIITTRDAHLLCRADQTYHVEELKLDKSLQLFSWHAFRHTEPAKEYVELSNEIVNYCGGLPLALEVIGSSLFRRRIPHWRDVIDKLKKIPKKEIHEKLRISYDTLDDTQKDMFLDIAFFFVGMNKEYVAKILEGRGFFPNADISILVERSLVKFDSLNDERLMMHDLIRDMGREVVREMSPRSPGNRSRIWFYEDAVGVLKKQMGRELVQGITLDVRESEYKSFSTESFAKMRCLELLQINGVHLTGSFKLISEELIWLCWLQCPLKSLPYEFSLNNLVVLDMQHSNIEELWKEKKILNKLKILNLSYSKHLVKTPNLHSSSLEKLMLEGCSSLVEVDQSIGHLTSLVLLDLEGCTKLKIIPETIGDANSLQILNIFGCSELEKLPERMGEIHSLTEVLFDGTYREQFLSSVGPLKHVKRLTWRGFELGPPESPDSVSLLSFMSLWLSFSGSKFGATNCCVDFGSLYSLEHLDLCGNNFLNLPAGIGSLPKLELLSVRKCPNLVSISELPSSLGTLLAWDCKSLEGVRLPIQSIGPNLFLELAGCENLIDIQGMDGAGDHGLVIFSVGCHNLSNNYNQSLVEAFYKRQYHSRISELRFSGGEMPHWFSYRGEGCSKLSFGLPPVFQALIVWVVFDSSESDCRVIIRNESNGLQLIHKFIFPVGLPGHNESVVSYIRFSEEEMERCCGHELELSFVEGCFAEGKEIKVKECGVHVIVEKPESPEDHSEWDPHDIANQGITSSCAGTDIVIPPELYHHRLHHPFLGSITASTYQQWNNYLLRELPSWHINLASL